MEKIVVSRGEIAQISTSADEPRGVSAKLPPAIPLWVKFCLSPLVLVLPLLCVLAVVLRIAVRGMPPRNRFAWVSFFSTLLAISGLLTSVAAVIVFSVGPTPSVISQGLSELDSRTQFPSLPASADLSAEQAASELKPLVTVISPAQKTWFSRTLSPSPVLGAGVLLEANAKGYLIVTARHVVDAELPGSKTNHALVASLEGIWSGAQVVARHQTLDLALIWLPRETGNAEFMMPVAAADQIKDGEPIYVIGHPQDLRFTLSTGIVSRKDADAIQITAPISPGNSGGPLFDSHGELAGIVTSMVDRSRSPNAESLNFAVRADALMEPSGWTFSGNGQSYLAEFDRLEHTQSH